LCSETGARPRIWLLAAQIGNDLGFQQPAAQGLAATLRAIQTNSLSRFGILEVPTRNAGRRSDVHRSAHFPGWLPSETPRLCPGLPTDCSLQPVEVLELGGPRREAETTTARHWPNAKLLATRIDR
jgi:hypothetical protein